MILIARKSNEIFCSPSYVAQKISFVLRAILLVGGAIACFLKFEISLNLLDEITVQYVCEKMRLLGSSFPLLCKKCLRCTQILGTKSLFPMHRYDLFGGH